MRVLLKSPTAMGAGLFLLFSAGFVVDAWFALANDGRNAFDLSCANDWKDFSQEHHGLTRWVAAFTYVGSIYVLGPVALAGILWHLWSGKRWLAVAWLCILLGDVGLNKAIKDTCKRDRPKKSGLLETVVIEGLDDFSFPSHHSMGSTIVFGLVAYSLILQSKRISWGVLSSTAILIVLVAAICFSRVYLRAHWATDVMGGFLMGAAWLALTLGIAEEWRRRHTSSRLQTANSPASP